jgi:hypothetical protein
MGHQDRTQDIKAGRLLELIREKPTLYLGETSLTGLWHFLRGYRMAEGDHGIDDVIQLPTDFLDWVAYRLHYYESTSGWRRMILGRVPNERAALMRFYELLEYPPPVYYLMHVHAAPSSPGANRTQSVLRFSLVATLAYVVVTFVPAARPLAGAAL